MAARGWTVAVLGALGCAVFDPPEPARPPAAALGFRVRDLPAGLERAAVSLPKDEQGTGRSGLGFEVVSVRDSEHALGGEAPVRYRRGAITGSKRWEFSCGEHRLPGERHHLSCFIDERFGERWLLSLASRPPWSHRVGYLVGPRTYRVVTDAPLSRPERAFLYPLNADQPVAAGDRDVIAVAPGANQDDAALAVLLLASLPPSPEPGPPWPERTDDGDVSAFAEIGRRFPRRLLGDLPPPIESTPRAPEASLIALLETEGALAHAAAARRWAADESGAEANRQGVIAGQRSLGLFAELSGTVASGFRLEGFGEGAPEGATVQGGFALGFGAVLFERLGVLAEGGLTLPVLSDPGQPPGLSESAGGSYFVFLGPRIRVLLTEVNDPFGLFVGGYVHGLFGGGGQVGAVLFDLQGERFGAFGGAERCLLGGPLSRACVFTEIAAQHVVLRFDPVPGQDPDLVQAIAVRQIEGFVPELRLGLRAAF